MKMPGVERVIYTHNPLSEVVCQVRFQKLSELENELPEALRNCFENIGYKNIKQTKQSVLSVSVDSGQGKSEAIVSPLISTLTSSGGDWSVAICSEFLALTSTNYICWEEFLDRLSESLTLFFSIYRDAIGVRLGLRYIDIIERDVVGLDNEPWQNLISSFLLGPMQQPLIGLNESESLADGYAMQANIKMNDARLILNSALLTSNVNNARAFLIDADHYVDLADSAPIITNLNQVTESFIKLHDNASELFRKCITEKLHDALGPKPI